MAAIAGVVRTVAGDPVAGARVYVVEAPVAVADVAAQTGADGRFSLTAAADGTYVVGASADRFTSATVTVVVPGDEVDLRLAPT